MEYDRFIVEDILEQGSRVCLEYKLEENIFAEYHFILNKRNPIQIPGSKGINSAAPKHATVYDSENSFVECVYYKSTLNDPLKLFGTKFKMDEFMNLLFIYSDKLAEIRVFQHNNINYFDGDKDSFKILPKVKILSNEQDLKKENFSMNQREKDKQIIEKLLESFKPHGEN